MSQYFGEEREKYAIFSVSLKKIRYGSPSVADRQDSVLTASKELQDSSSHSVAHLQWETVLERTIKAGTLPKLTECLLNALDFSMDTCHFNVYFCTYRAFASQNDVINLLTTRYKETIIEESDGQRKAAILNGLRSVFVCWLDLFPDDFFAPPKYSALHSLLDFARRNVPHLQDAVLRAANLLQKFRADEATHTSKRYFLHRLCLGNVVDDFIAGVAAETNGYGLADLLHISSRYFAEQLTYFDSELFKRVMVHQCLGCFWSKRHKISVDEVYSVRATIEQFNAVSYRVMSTILQRGLHPTARTKLIAKWIDILKELRLLKNYSSVKAVLSGLSSESVYRLKSVWNLVPRDKLDLYENLSRIFSEDNNSSATREILEKEGTAKIVVPLLHSNIKGSERNGRVNAVQGAVPYLGTFLTDLTYIDSAFPDYVGGDLINFEKRRKEFEVIAQIKLFQATAHSYAILPDEKFRLWFARLPLMTEDECFASSSQIQPPLTSTPLRSRKDTQKHKNSVFGSISSIFAFDATSTDNTQGASTGNSRFYATPAQPACKHNSLHSQRNAMSSGRSVPSFADISCDSRLPQQSARQHRRESASVCRPHLCQPKHAKSSSRMASSCNQPSVARLVDGMHRNSFDSASSTSQHREHKSSPAAREDSNSTSPLLSRHRIPPQSGIVVHSFSNNSSGSWHSCTTSPSVSYDENANAAPAFPWFYHQLPLYLGATVESAYASQPMPLLMNSDSLRCVISNGSGAYNVPRQNVQRGSHKNERAFSSKVMSRSSSCQSLDLANAKGNGEHLIADNDDVRLVSSGLSNAYNVADAEDFYIVRISLDDSVQSDDNRNTMYKCMKITSNDKTSSVIERALEKLQLDGSVGDFCLVQVLADGEHLELPERSNAYYAVNSNDDMQFLLKKKAPELTDETKIKKKRHKIRTNLLRWNSGFL